MKNTCLKKLDHDNNVLLLNSITRLLRQMAWTWIGYLLVIAIFEILFIISSPDLIHLMGISKTYVYLTFLLPLCAWSFVSRYMFEVARGLENDFELWERRAKIIGVIAGIFMGPPLLSYQAWHLLKKLKQYSQQD